MTASRVERRGRSNHDITRRLVIELKLLNSSAKRNKPTINPGPENNTCKCCILTVFGSRLTIFIAPPRCTALPIMPHDEMVPISIWPWECSLYALFWHTPRHQETLKMWQDCAKTGPRNQLLNWDGSWRISNNNKNNLSTEEKAASWDGDILFFWAKWKYDSNWADILAIAHSNSTSNGSNEQWMS